MKGIRACILSEQSLRFEEFDLPDSCGPTELLVKLERTIISAGTELSIYTGLEPDTRIPGRWCTYPWAPGYGGIGRVLARGDAVQGFPVGSRVYGVFHHGTHAIVDTARSVCVPVPDGLDSTTAVFARMGNVALTAYQQSRVTLGDGVAIIGLGLVGNLAGQFFACAGQNVAGIDLAAHRRELAVQTGFRAAVDPAGLTPADLLARVQEGLGVRPRVVVDAVGDSRLVELGCSLAANNGQVIILGTPRAVYSADMTPMLKDVHLRGISVTGALEWVIPLLERQGRPPTTESNARLILRMLADGALHVQPLCSHVLPPAELNAAYQGLLHRKDEYMGVVLDWENNPPPM